MESKRGMSVLLALGVLVFITILATAVQYLMNNSERGQRVAKIRFAISILENRIRLKLSMPESYTCSSVTDPILGALKRCDLPTNFWDEFKKSIPGAKCDAGITFCGVEVKSAPLFVQSSTLPLTFNSIVVSYNGNDLRFNPVPLSPIEVPAEAILSSASGSCPGLGDIFKGIKKDGTVVCEPRPGCNQAGKYFVGLDSKGAAICKELNGIDFDINGNITRIPGLSCPKASDGSQKYFESIQFNCDSLSKKCKIEMACKERVDPCSIATSGLYCPQ